ncbi:DUF4253 domain-containing protein [Streptomyces sp. NBC_01275]|uniref:DUF4253 domain-containing protein n=1 Tax=Streptomyces sp. NBC_01275 TaxID=2903807 RepID=UPI00224D3CEA|nr:DUF4253 domain-containing protein [Streptomyces sp. NBC_01275]MCX4764101.1 DUF4253 domain-containing protein [Streptomyces sp. NBC_01275]
MATLPNPLPQLASDPSGRSLGLQLPPGRLIDATAGEVVLWHAEQQAASGAWKALGRPAGRAGLLPVLVDLGSRQGGPEEWELVPELMSYPGDHDVEEVLAEYWDDVATQGEEWPGLAEPTTLTADPDARATEIADALSEGPPGFKEPHLALVSARRSADIPASVGWSGSVDHEEDVARLSAVLRSWEDRFGIRVVALGYDRLTVSVAAPPADLAEAEAVAAEHFAFCPYSVLPGPDDTLTAYAQHLIGERAWHFQWD